MQIGERFNSATHLLGFFLAIGAAILLLLRVDRSGADAVALASCLVFAVAMISVYFCSTAYHWSHGKQKGFWQKADHCSIFLLIAGTYTPLGLIPLRDAWGIPMTTAVWLLAVLGILRELRASSLEPSVLQYLAMGWIGVMAAIPIMSNLSISALIWLIVCVCCYTAGIAFYQNDHRWRHAHGIWHLFVLSGTASHVLMVLAFMPARPI